MLAPKMEGDPEWRATRILVVDDDVELCELVDQYLTAQGFQIEAVHDGTAGIDSALSGRHEMVILDVMLPGVRGFEVLRQIRAKSAIPVIMLTAHGDDVDRIVGLEIGADDYLPKPFTIEALYAAVDTRLKKAQALRDEAEKKMADLRCV